MTATEKAKRSDALYYETVSVNRRVLCDMVANREADLEDARAENAKLRESVKRLMTQRDERLARAEADNAKLRELVWDMYCLAYPSAVEWEVSDAAYDKYSPCEKCDELHGGKSPCASTAKDMTEECCKPIQAAVVADRIRELGVEVDA